MKGLTYNPKNVTGGTTLAGVKISRNGEIEAGSQKELLHQIGRLLTASSGPGDLQRELANRTSEFDQDRRREHRELLAAAATDPSLWAEAGTIIAASINQNGVRSGFCRNLLVVDPLAGGDEPKIRVKQMNVTAVLATGTASTGTQFVRNKILRPAEFYIVANLEVDGREIAQDTGEVLDEKLAEGNEAITVQEDRVLKRAFDDSVGGSNPLTSIVGALTPNLLATIAEQVTNWGLPLGGALIANDFWKDISTNSNWQNQFDPVSQMEVLLTGRLGAVLGMPITTDGFRPVEQKVLEAGEIYVFSTKEYLGAMTDRGGVVPTPLSGAALGRTTRGWFLEELFSLMVANTRAVAKGQR